MSKKKENAENNDAPAQEEAQKNQTIPSMPVIIHAQYVRDVSFENPNAIQALKTGQDAPKMDINFTMDAAPIEDSELKGMYEVSLIVSATAKRDDNVVFIAEVEYGVVVSLTEGVPEERHHPLLLIEVPRLVFPFARQIIADLTANGGYPPLLLNPVNFQKLYLNRFGKQIQDSKDTEAAKS